MLLFLCIKPLQEAIFIGCIKAGSTKIRSAYFQYNAYLCLGEPAKNELSFICQQVNKEKNKRTENNEKNVIKNRFIL